MQPNFNRECLTMTGMKNRCSNAIQNDQYTLQFERMPSTCMEYRCHMCRYDSIVLLWYKPWERAGGAQGYAMLTGICHPENSEFNSSNVYLPTKVKCQSKLFIHPSCHHI
jgi:hypothetical protein